MKHIFVEGPDNVGKTLLIKKLCEHFAYNNVSVRHFGKPPKGMSSVETLDFQFEVFSKEMLFADYIRNIMDKDDKKYHENVIIWDRTHLGEYVHSQLFRGIDKNIIKPKLLDFEKQHLKSDQYLILFTSDPMFLLQHEDGESLSQTLEEKTQESKLFKEIFNLSIIQNKKIIKVDNDNNYRDKNKIFNEVLELIKTN